MKMPAQVTVNQGGKTHVDKGHTKEPLVVEFKIHP